MKVSKGYSLLLFSVAPMVVWAQAAAPPSVADLAQQLAAAEARIQDLDVRMTLMNQEFESATAGDYSNTVRWVVKAPFGSRFRLEQEGSKPWKGGPQSVAHLSAVLAFDGNDSWELSRSGLTGNGVQTAGGWGRISSGMQPGVALGEGYRDMTFWRHNGRPLSDVIVSDPGTTVELTDLDGVGEVYRVSILGSGLSGDKIVVPETIYLDPARGLAVMRVEAGGFDAVIRVTELIQPAPGIWLPGQGIYELRVDGNLRRLLLWQVDSILVNTNPGEELFSIDFPAGTMVSDARTGIGFQVGFRADDADEAMEAQASAARTAVKQLSAGQKVEIPLLAFEDVPIPPLPTEPQRSQASLPRWLVGAGVGLGAALASILCIAAISLRKTKLVLFCVLLAISAVGLVLTGTGTYVLASKPTTGSRSPSASHAVFDCGRSILGVLARYYDTGWHSEDVIRYTGTMPGMSLLQIRDTIRAMGIRAEGKQISTMEQLTELLREPESTVVLATQLGDSDRQIGHFFRTVGATPKHFIVIDPPRPVHLLTGDDIGRAITAGKGYALLVQPASRR